MTELLDLSPSEAAAQVSADADGAWTRSFLDELDHRVRGEPLERIVALWNLSGAAAARLFGVSRQAFAKWLHAGPPAERTPQVADLAAATEILARYVKRERIPAVVRRAAPALGGRSLLELAQEGRSRDVLFHARSMFDLRRVQP
jgi:hypothetical protein